MSFPFIISRIEARELGLKYYYAGNPCVYRHASPRYTSTGMCMGCNKMFSHRYMVKDREKHRTKGRTYYANNKQKCSDAASARHKKNIEENRKKSRMWVANNSERHRENAKKWRKEHPEKVRLYANNRRARKLGNGGVHTTNDIDEIMKMQKGKCAYCRTKLGSTRQVDHIEPLSCGGSNDRSNLQILCKPCNLRKRARDPIVFAQSLGMLL